MFYGDATGTFSARKIARTTYELMPFHFLAGGLHPDHDTIANFRKTFLQELKDLFVHLHLYAQEMGVLTWPLNSNGTENRVKGVAGKRTFRSSTIGEEYG